MRFSFKILFILAVFSGFVGCSQKSEQPEQRITASRAVDNPYGIDRIFLITIDTLRADHLGCYGYPRNTSPFIDSLAEKSILFTKAFSNSATTSPSHASLFTSLYPIQHKVIRNYHILDESFVTLAELMRDGGYQTAGVVSFAPLFIEGNLHRGFDFFFEPEYARKNVGRNAKYRVARDSVSAAIKWLNEQTPDERFFLWLHLFDPHTPRKPEKRFLRKFENKSEEEFQSFTEFLLSDHKIPLKFYGNDPKKMTAAMNRYDAEVLFVDTELRRFYRRAEKNGLNARSLWIVTSDHGEGLGNHGWGGHVKNIYNEQLHVPLIIHSPSDAFGKASIDHVVNLVDLLPTITELGGVSLSKRIDGMQGESLVALFSESEEGNQPKGWAFAQSRRFPSPKGPPLKYALQEGDYKYIYHESHPDEFFQLEKDPYETTSIAESETEKEKEMKGKIEKMIKEYGKPSKLKPRSMSKEIIEMLKDIGYVQ